MRRALLSALLIRTNSSSISHGQQALHAKMFESLQSKMGLREMKKEKMENKMMSSNHLLQHRRPLSTTAIAKARDLERKAEASNQETALNSSTTSVISTAQNDNEKLALNIMSWKDNTLDAGYRGYFLSGNRDEDIHALVENFTTPAIARALRDREKTLIKSADCLEQLLKKDNLSMTDLQPLRDILKPYRPAVVEKIKDDVLILPDRDKGGVFSAEILDLLRIRLSRLPREITTRAEKRASVVLPLCHVQQQPSVLLTLRSMNVNRHRGEVCLPGGMVGPEDTTIVDAGLRELREETGIKPEDVDVLGVLRCDWSEMTSITGIAVTPMVAYVGNIEDLVLDIDPGEVKSIFSVTIDELADLSNWEIRPHTTPVFKPKGAPVEQVVWGLTAYILEKFLRLLPSVVFRNIKKSRSKSP